MNIYFQLYFGSKPARFTHYLIKLWGRQRCRQDKSLQAWWRSASTPM